MRDCREVLHRQPVLAVDLGGHTAAIRQADVDQLGNYAVTGSVDKTVRVWSIADGQCLRVIRLPAGPGNVGKVLAVAISPDATLIAAGGTSSLKEEPDNEEHIYLIDRRTGEFIQFIPDLPFSVVHLTFSHDSNYLAATHSGGGIRVFSRQANWAEVGRDSDYGHGSYGAAFAPDGRLVTTCWDGNVRLYDSGLRLLEIVKPHGFFLTSVRFVDLEPHDPLQPRSPAAHPHGVAFSPDASKLVVGYADRSKVDVFDAYNLRLLATPELSGVDSGNLAIVAWSKNDILYAAGTYERESRYYVVAKPMSENSDAYSFPVSRNSVMSIVPLTDGGLLLASADPKIAVLENNGSERWVQDSLLANFMGQDGMLSVSPDGQRVNFGFEFGGEDRAQFSVQDLILELGPVKDDTTLPPDQISLAIESWRNRLYPKLNDLLLFTAQGDIIRSLAIDRHTKHFVLGSDWWLYAFDADGKSRWRCPSPAGVRAVNITQDGRLAVVACDDGTIRWHKMKDGAELLAFMPHGDRLNWIAWTPEGFYAATPGAHGVLRWHINRDWGPAESVPVSDIPGFYRPTVLALVLQELETPRAIGLAVSTEQSRLVYLRAKSSVSAGAQLHLLAIGISHYNDENASHLTLSFARADAEAIASILNDTQQGFYAKLNVQYLPDELATRSNVLRALSTVDDQMTRVDDLAVVFFSGHGAIIQGELYLLPHDVNARDIVGIKATALSFTAFKAEIMRLAERGRVLVLLDACYSGAASLDGKTEIAGQIAISSALAARNATVLTSSSANKRSREDPAWRHGAFTKILLDGLAGPADENKDGLISTTELANYLDRHVRQLTGEEQTPSMDVRFPGNVFAVALKGFLKPAKTIL